MAENELEDADTCGDIYLQTGKHTICMRSNGEFLYNEVLVITDKAVYLAMKKFLSIATIERED